MTSSDENVICCFCGLSLPEATSVLLEVYPTPRRDESQALYCHRKCLVAHLRPGIPLHPELEREDVIADRTSQ
jgi:hypothetical protein